jgi:hypothetical protein
MYDKLVNQLFQLLGVKYPRASNGLPLTVNEDKLVVLGQQRLSPKHKGSRPSKHAVFWQYFMRKAAAIGVETYGLVEYRSSKVCMSCCRRIHHEKEKNYRVYYCDHCEKHAHRDDSSAEIHCAVVWTEIVGYSQALANNELLQQPSDNGDSENRIKVRYYRPNLFKAKWMLDKPEVPAAEAV